MIKIIFISILSGVLWRVAGYGWKENHGTDWLSRLLDSVERWWACGTVIAIGWFLLNGHWVGLLYIPVVWAVLALASYGINAPLHKFVANTAGYGWNGREPEIEGIVRGICGFIWSLAGLVFVIAGGGLTAWMFYCALCTLLCAYIGYKNPQAFYGEFFTGLALGMAVAI